MDYLQRYAALRLREDQRLDGMLLALTDCQLFGWTQDPTWQTLYIVNWRTAGLAEVTIKCDNGHIEFTHTNIDGETVHKVQVDNADHDGIEREARAAVEHLTAVGSGT